MTTKWNVCTSSLQVASKKKIRRTGYNFFPTLQDLAPFQGNKKLDTDKLLKI